MQEYKQWLGNNNLNMSENTNYACTWHLKEGCYGLYNLINIVESIIKEQKLPQIGNKQ